MDVKGTVQRLVLSSLPTGQKRSAIDPEEDLLVGGVIDSVSLVELVAALEGEFDIELGDEDVVMDNFQTVTAIEGLVESKRQDAI